MALININHNCCDSENEESLREIKKLLIINNLKLDQIMSQLSELQAEVEALAQQVIDLQATTDAEQADIALILEQNAAIKVALEETIEDLEATIEELEAAIENGATAADLEALKASVTSIKIAVESASADIASTVGEPGEGGEIDNTLPGQPNVPGQGLPNPPTAGNELPGGRPETPDNTLPNAPVRPGQGLPGEQPEGGQDLPGGVPPVGTTLPTRPGVNPLNPKSTKK